MILIGLVDDVDNLISNSTIIFMINYDMTQFV